MIACVFHGRALLLLPADFSSQVDRLLRDWKPLDSVAFKIAALQNTAIGSARENYPQWEHQFIGKLEGAIVDRTFDPCYSFEGEDARMHIDDYLEAFRSSFRYIDVASSLMHDGRDLLYSVSIRKKQNILDRALRRYGRTLDEWNFLRSEVKRIAGSSLNFKATIGQLVYVFAPEGVRRETTVTDASQVTPVGN